MSALENIRTIDLGALVVREVRATGATVIGAHGHDAPHLTIVASGMITDSACGATEILKAGDALFRPAGVHQNSVAERGSTGVIIELQRDFLAPFCAHAAGACGRPIRAEATVLRELVTKILAELRANDALMPVIFPALVQQFLVQGIRTTHADALRKPPSWAIRVIEHIDRNYKRQISMAELADVSGVTQVTVRLGMKRWYGRTVATLLRERRVAAAIELLETGLPLSEIALECGFYDQSHFTRCFRTVRGISPWKYRTATHGNSYQLR